MELDQHLSFNQHVDKVCGKVNQRTGLLWRVRPYISTNLAKQLYTSLIKPHFLYLDYIYDGCNKTALQNLQVCQNNSLGAVLRTDCRHSATALHIETEVEWLSTMRRKSTCLQVFKSVHGLNPSSINNMFSIFEPARELRSKNEKQIRRPRTNTIMCDANIRVRGAIYWGDLPPLVSSAPTVASFKCRLKDCNEFMKNK